MIVKVRLPPPLPKLPTTKPTNKRSRISRLMGGRFQERSAPQVKIMTLLLQRKARRVVSLTKLCSVATAKPTLPLLPRNNPSTLPRALIISPFVVAIAAPPKSNAWMAIEVVVEVGSAASRTAEEGTGRVTTAVEVVT